MLLLLFEVTPRDGHVEEYLEIAARLRPQLDAQYFAPPPPLQPPS